MEEEIEKSVDIILQDIEFTEKLEMRDSRSKARLLPSDFGKFVKKRSEQSTKKASDYLLTKCYSSVYSAASYAANLCVDLTYRPLNLAEDRKTLEYFQKICHHAEPLSLRELNRILEPSSVPLTHPNARISAYSKNQNDVVAFTVHKVFPVMLLHAKRPLLSVLASKDWKEIICKYPTEKGFPTGVVEINPELEKEFEAFMRSSFEQLRKIEELPEEDQDPHEIGCVLLGIYDKICVYHKNGMIWGIPDYRKKSRRSKSSEENMPPLMDDEIYKYDSLISEHILNLMEWTHVVHEDTAEFMKYMDRIIDKVRVQVLSKTGVTFTLEELRKFRKKDQVGGSLFLWNGNESLLRRLIDTIHDEPEVFFEQHENRRST